MSNLILYFNYYYCTYSSFFKGAEYVTLLVYKGKHKIQDIELLVQDHAVVRFIMNL